MVEPSRTASQGARRRAVRRDAALKAHERHQGRRAWVTATLGGTVGVLLLGGVTTAGSFFPAEQAQLDAELEPASLSASTGQYVCPPAPKLPEDAGEGSDVEFSPISTDAEHDVVLSGVTDLAGELPGSTLRTTVGSGDSQGGPEMAEQRGERLTESQPEDLQQGDEASSNAEGVPVNEGWTDSISDPGGENELASVLAVEPLGSEPGSLSGLSTFSASDGDLTGLDVSGCAAPAHQQQLTGASTSSGNTAVLVLTNPTATAASVDLSVYGSEGRISASGTHGIVLGPDQTRSFVLGGFAPDEDNVAVQVSSSGAEVAASIQQHRLFGVDPGGVDIIQPGAQAAQSAVMPAVSVSGSESEAAPAVQLAAPNSSAPTEADITVIGEDGPVEFDGDSSVEVPTSGTLSVPLEGLDSGQYTVRVDADHPVTAAARGHSGGDDTDFSVIPAVADLSFNQVTTLPEGGDATLMLYSDHGGKVEITPIDDSGETGAAQTQELDAEGTLALDADDLGAEGDAAGFKISTTDSGIYGAVTVSDDEALSGYPMTAQQGQSTDVNVRVGY